MKIACCLLLISLISLNAKEFSEDFESYAGKLDSWKGNGELVEYNGSVVLKLTIADLQTFDVGEYGKSGRVTFDIYDYGDIPAPEGPRWGVADADQLAAVCPSLRAGANEKYYFSPIKNPAMTDKWYGVAFIGPGGEEGQRPATLESSAGANDGSGAWITWEFDIAEDGTVTATGSSPTYSRSKVVGAVDDLQEIFFYAHPDSANGLMVDNIRFTPN